MLSEAEIAQLEQGVQNILRIPGPIEEGSDEEALIDGIVEDLLATNPASVDGALVTFATSDEAEVTRIVTSYYQVFLGRQPDAAGLTYWVNQTTDLIENGQNPIQATEGLAAAFSRFTNPATGELTEFGQEYGGLSVEAVVREFYLNNLDRDPITSGDIAGFQFWVDVTNTRIEQNVDAGLSGTEAVREAYSRLAVDFVFASETQDVVFALPITTLLVNLGTQGDDALDPDSNLFEVENLFFPTAEQLDGDTTLVRLNSADGAEEISGGDFTVAGVDGLIDTLRLTGDASVRIDLTDPREQLEGIDVDGSGTIEFDEQDNAFREQVNVSDFDIFDAHPRGDALLNPDYTIGDAGDIGYTGNISFDGTGFDGTGTFLNGNIVLGGWGQDTIFTGNGNDFVSTHAGDDVVKTGRNADFIYQELTTLDDAFQGDDGEVDGGATFDDDPAADSDWLLLEASDDEEAVTVTLQGSNFFSTLELSALLDQIASLNEDVGGLSTRLGNDQTGISNIENVNASGNFYKFFDEAVTTVTTSAYVGAGTFDDPDAITDVSGFTYFIVGRDPVVVTADDLADATTLDEVREITQAAFDEQLGAGLVEVPLTGDPRFDPDFGPTDPFDNPIGPIVLAVALDGSGIVFGEDNPNVIAAPEVDFVRNDLVADPDTAFLQSDLFFGDNRDFSAEEAEYRVPGLSPGVTAQMILVGSNAQTLTVDGVPIDNIQEDGGNILIAGYDNDFVAGLSGDDLLMGGDIEFLLTHRHNPNLFDTAAGTISVNGADGVADDGSDTLVGGEGDDNLAWEADAGHYLGNATETVSGGTDSDDGEDTLWLTTFSVGRATDVSISTDGSATDFLAVNPETGVPTVQDLTGSSADEVQDEADALAIVVEDNTLRFDLGMGVGQDFQGNGNDLAFIGDLAGADRSGTADQNNYNDGFGPSIITEIENFNASGLNTAAAARSAFAAEGNPTGTTGLDYLAAGIGDPDGTDLTFENQQNYRGSSSDIDIRGIDGAQAGDSDFTLDRLTAEFNSLYSSADGSALPSLVYSSSEFIVSNQSVSSGFVEGGIGSGFPTQDEAIYDTGLGNLQNENKLFTSRGDDVLEGRGGDDWLEGREGDDIFLIALNDGDETGGGTPFDGDDINIIARRQDRFDAEGNPGADGLVDTTVNGVSVGRDFRNDLPDGEPEITTFSTFEIQPIAGSNVVGGPDNWLTFEGIVFNREDGTQIVSTFAEAVPTAAQAAAILQADLGPDFTVFAGEATEDPDTEEVDVDPGQIDSVFIRFNPDVTQTIGDPLVIFDSDAGDIGNSAFAIEETVETVVTPPANIIEDDEIVFRAYQNRSDDESRPDQQVSLGNEAYAEDLVVGVQDGTTKLVEDQEYRIFIEDLKENDTVSLTLNGTTYTRTVDFSAPGAPTSQTTDQFLQDFADQINLAIQLDPHSRDGGIVVGFTAGGDPNSGTLVIREGETAIDMAEHVFIQFPQVSIENNSGGDAPIWSVKETSDTSVVIFDYDFRDETTEGLNRGFGVNEQRDGGTMSTDNRRFITFEDTSGINRAILQDAAVGGGLVEGLDITVFDQPFSPDFRDDDDGFEFGNEVLLQDRLATAPNDSWLPFDNIQGNANGGGVDTVGNGGGSGQPQAGEDPTFSGVNGDDNLRGSLGIDTLLGHTGDDRLTGSRNDNLTYLEVYNGGTNVVVDNATGVIVEATNESGLDQFDDSGETLLRFKDTLILEEGTDDGGRGSYNGGALFSVLVTNIAEDYSIDGTLDVDENADGLTEHTATIQNMEVIRTLSDTMADSITFGGSISGIVYDNTMSAGNVFFREGDTPFRAVDDPFGEGAPTFEKGVTGVADMSMNAQVQGFELVTGSVGDDWMAGNAQDEVLSGSTGNDTIFGNGGDDVVNGDAGDDELYGGAGSDVVNGGTGDDTLTDDAQDMIFGAADGDDVLNGGDGNDIVISGAGADAYNGDGGDDVFLVTPDGSADTITGGTGFDVVHQADNPALDEDNDDGDNDTGTGDFIDPFLDTADVEVITATNLFALADPVLSFFADGDNDGDATNGIEDDGNETITFNFFVPSTGESISVTSNVGADGDATSVASISAEVAVDLDAAGFNVVNNGTTVTVDGFGDDNLLVQVNDISTGGSIDADFDDLTGLGATSNQGAGQTQDLRQANYTAVGEFNVFGAALILSSTTFDSDILISGGLNGGSITYAASAPGEAVENQLGEGNFDPSAYDLSAITINGDVNLTTEVDDTLTGSSDDLSETFNGGLGDDDITARGGDDTVNGGDGDDTVDAGTGDDSVLAGSGDDSVEAGSGEDEVFGSDGDDTLGGQAGDDDIFGGNDDDSIDGGAGDDDLFGEDGDDTILGGDGSDDLFGGDGDDSLNGGGGIDFLQGDAGADTLTGSGGIDFFFFDDDLVPGSATENAKQITDFVEGDALWDGGEEAISIASTGLTGTIVEGTGSSFLDIGDAFTDGGAAGDIYVVSNGTNVQIVADYNANGQRDSDDLTITVSGVASTAVIVDNIFLDLNVVIGTDGNENGEIDPDTDFPALIGTAGDDIILGLGGEDSLFGGAGNDRLDGGADDDTLFGEGGEDILQGGAGDDDLDGGADNDILVGGAGDDDLFDFGGDNLLDGGDGGDVLSTGAGADTLLGGDDDDFLEGGAGDDEIDGGADEDTIFGDEDDDLIDGGAGDDTMEGEQGEDTLTGGDGEDDFVFDLGETVAGLLEVDVITDFAFGVDVIDIITSPIGTTIDGDEARAFFNLGDALPAGADYILSTDATEGGTQLIIDQVDDDTVGVGDQVAVLDGFDLDDAGGAFADIFDF